MRRLVLSRQLATWLCASWVLAVAGALAGSTTILLAAILVGFIAILGTEVPHRAMVKGSIQLNAASIAEGEPVEVSLHLINSGRRPRLVEWEVQLPGPTDVPRGANAGVVHLAGKASADETFSAAFGLFGLQAIGPVRLRLEDPWGFCALEGPSGDDASIRVYPRHEALDHSFLRTRQQRTLMGLYEVSQPGHGFEFFGLRDYTVGDRPRDVNWKASGRVGRVIVNQHQQENDAEIVIFVDTRKVTGAGRQTKSPFAAGCRAALSLAKAHIGQRDAVRIVFYGSGVVDNSQASLRHMQAILDLAVGLHPSGNDSLLTAVHSTLSDMRNRSPVCVISTGVDDSGYAAALALLRAREFPVYAILPSPDWVGKIPPARWVSAEHQSLRAVAAIGAPHIRLGGDAPLVEQLRQVQVSA